MASFNAEPSRLAIPTSNGYLFRNVQDLTYCRSDKNGTWIYCRDGHRFFSSKSIRGLEEILPENFFRIHSSVLINLSHVASSNCNRSLQVVMIDGEKLDVSRRQHKKLKEILVQL